MKISARNVLKGKVKSIKKGDLLAEVVIGVARGVDVVSLVPIASLGEIGIGKGKEVYAAFDASSVMVGTPHHKRGE